MNQDERWLLTEKYAGVETAEFEADLARLRAGEPLAYVIGHVPFCNTVIHLDSRPLIPRPETEFWTERAIAAMKARATSLRILDLCAGSGAIGVAVATAIEHAEVTFGEIDPTHLPTIEKNVVVNGISPDRVHVCASDLFTNISGMFDYIVSNPPYIDPVLNRTEAGVRDFEPHRALYGGVRGMELITRIITDAPRYLNENGELWLEHEPEQSTEIHTLAQTHGFTATTHLDQYHTERYSILTKTPLPTN